MKKHKCRGCGYVYNPEMGDPESGVKAGIPFEMLKDDWTCPSCGEGKDGFDEE